LFTLRRADGPLSPSALSGALLVATGTMTGRLDRLEKLELIRRVPHPTDRRALEIELTPHGRELVDQAIGEHLAREHDWLSVLTGEEREQLVRITRKLLVKLSH
jgi:DNA-binding MarR family transcriptional regulator